VLTILSVIVQPNYLVQTWNSVLSTILAFDSFVPFSRLSIDSKPSIVLTSFLTTRVEFSSRPN